MSVIHFPDGCSGPAEDEKAEAAARRIVRYRLAHHIRTGALHLANELSDVLDKSRCKTFDDDFFDRAVCAFMSEVEDCLRSELVIRMGIKSPGTDGGAA